MRNFVITVNGTSYEVAVEEVEAGAAPVAAAPVAAPAAAPKAAPKAAAPKAVADFGGFRLHGGSGLLGANGQRRKHAAQRQSEDHTQNFFHSA